MQTSAVILAAGIGNRLRPHTQTHPKCLLPVGSRTMLGHQLQSLSDAGVRHVVIVTGHGDAFVREFVTKEFPGIEVVFAYNDAYATTQNIRSLATALPHVPEGARVLQINSDVVYDAPLIARMLELEEGSYSAVRCAACGDEEMKVSLTDSGAIKAMNKRIDPKDALGEAFGVHLYSPRFWQRLSEEVTRLSIEAEQEYFEYAIESLLPEHELRPYDIGTMRAMEIDFPEDLERAREVFRDR